MKALIFVEKKDGSPVGASLELFSAAQALGAEAVAVAVAPAEGGLLEDAITDAVAKKAEECGADLVLLAATPIGKLVCARIAARIGAGSVNDAIALACEDGKLQVTRPVYGGTIQETLQVETKAAVVSVRGASYPAPETVPAIEEISSDAELRAKVVELIAEAGEAVNLEDAKVIVTGGRGIGSEENLGLCKELAEVLGGAIGRSDSPARSLLRSFTLPAAFPVRHSTFPECRAASILSQSIRMRKLPSSPSPTSASWEM